MVFCPVLSLTGAGKVYFDSGLQPCNPSSVFDQGFRRTTIRR